MDSILIAATYLLLIVIFVVTVFGVVSMLRLRRDVEGPRLSDLLFPQQEVDEE